jgi:hypothetical protein
MEDLELIPPNKDLREEEVVVGGGGKGRESDHPSTEFRMPDASIGEVIHFNFSCT